MIHNSVSDAAPTRPREGPAWSQREWSESAKGLVSIRGSLCPCNGVEFWFYLIGGSHPLFRNAGAKKPNPKRRAPLNNSGGSSTNSAAALLSSPLSPRDCVPCLPPPPSAHSLILLSILAFVRARTGFGRRRTGGDAGVHATQGLRGAKRKPSVAVRQE